MSDFNKFKKWWDNKYSFNESGMSAEEIVEEYSYHAWSLQQIKIDKLQKENDILHKHLEQNEKLKDGIREIRSILDVKTWNRLDSLIDKELKKLYKEFEDDTKYLEEKE